MLFDESATTLSMTGTSAVHQVIAHRAIPGSMPLADIVGALCLGTGLTEQDSTSLSSPTGSAATRSPVRSPRPSSLQWGPHPEPS